MKCQQCFYYEVGISVGISAAKTVNHDFDRCFVNPETVKIPNRTKPCRYFRDMLEGTKNTEQLLQPDKS